MKLEQICCIYSTHNSQKLFDAWNSNFVNGKFGLIMKFKTRVWNEINLMNYSCILLSLNASDDNRVQIMSLFMEWKLSVADKKKTVKKPLCVDFEAFPYGSNFSLLLSLVALKEIVDIMPLIEGITLMYDSKQSNKYSLFMFLQHEHIFYIVSWLTSLWVFCRGMNSFFMRWWRGRRRRCY